MLLFSSFLRWLSSETHQNYAQHWLCPANNLMPPLVIASRLDDLHAKSESGQDRTSSIGYDTILSDC
jgi:hypothetical protein